MKYREVLDHKEKVDRASEIKVDFDAQNGKYTRNIL